VTSLLSAELVGSQSPRIHSRPDYVSTAGLEAIELAESAGLFLDPWQQFVLSESLGERRGGKWAAFEVGLIVPRQNGKGSILEARELFGLFLGGEKLLIHTSQLFVTSLDAFRRIRYLIENTPDLDRKVKKMGPRAVGYRTTTGQESIELRDGSRLKFMARSPGSGRGLTGDLVILDEAYGLTDPQVDSLLPTLSARPNPQLWYTSSPVLDADTGLPLTAMRRRGLAGGAGLAYFEWSVESGTDLDDRTAWALANPALGFRITEEAIARERASLTDEGFARERLCIWPPDAATQWQIITEDQWKAAHDAASAAKDPVSLAVYVTPDRRTTCIGAAGAREDGDLSFGVYAHHPGTDWVPGTVVQAVRDLNPCRLVIDKAGAGANLVVEVAAALREAELDIEVTTMTSAEVGQAYGMVADALTRSESAPVWRLWHRGQPEMTAAVAGAVTRSLGREGTTWDTLATSADLSPIIAGTNAVWGYVTRPDDQPFFGSWR